MITEIHETAIVDPGAELGSNVEIGPYTIVGPNVKIGDGCKIYPHVFLDGITTIGADCQIFPFASIGARPQDLKFSGEPSTLVIGSGNILRENVTLQPGTEHGNMTTIIGDNNLLMANSHVGHDCVIGSNNIFANSAGLAGHVTVLDNVILGGMVGIHQFCRIGSYAMLSAGSMVGHDVPPYCIAQGDRCFLRGVNIIGLQRAGFSKEEASAIKKVYRSLFSTVGQVKEKIKNLPTELTEVPAVAAMLKFISETERGITSPSKSASS